jgi:hypothetical protein
MIELDNAFIGSEPREETTMLPKIPVLDVGLDWPFETLEREFERINATAQPAKSARPILLARRFPRAAPLLPRENAPASPNHTTARVATPLKIMHLWTGTRLVIGFNRFRTGTETRRRLS